MERAVVKVDAKRVTFATSAAIRIKDAALKNALRAAMDSEKVKRQEEHFCVPCFYFRDRIAGQAMTTQPCGFCEVPVLYASTNTDMLCLKCAQQNSLCKHCAGDYYMRSGRVFKEEIK